MSSPFAITAASNSVFLDADRQGETSFTVSNRSGREMEGRARLVVEDPEAESWITLRGSLQRKFAIAGTETYVAEVEVPPDAPSGTYNFRISMVGEERPDEQYVEGPTVTFEVPEPSPGLEAGPFPWKVVTALAVVLVLGVGGVIWWSSGNGNDNTRAEPAAVSRDEPADVTTTLTDRPPIPLADREGVMVFGPYSNRDMDPACTVTDVSARLIGAQGTIEVIEDAVGTNNLHVAVRYETDREMARTEIAWEVEHPSDVECTVR